MRETARDTLFLSDLPARRLPWAYLAIAILALGGSALSRRFEGRLSHRRVLAIALALGAFVDLGFWGLATRDSSVAVFAFYVWTGLLSTIVTLHFWLHMAGVFDVAEAKRTFPWIAAGGLIGAVTGSTAASLLLLVLPTHALVLGSSLLFAGASTLPGWLPAAPRTDSERTAQLDSPREGHLGPRELASSPYLLRLLAIVALTAILGTAVDFAFKSEVAAVISRERLGLFFARFQLGVNIAALVFQLALAPLLLRSLGVIRALAVLPGLLVCGAAMAVASTALLPVLLLKATDGALRHSLQRSGTEILFLPLPPAMRTTFKALVESLAQRGGQALASLGIVAATAVHPEPSSFAFALLGLGGLALAPLIGLRSDYIARFREQLAAGRRRDAGEMPPIELHSLEVLISSLSSPLDAEVLSALDILDGYGKTSLVPPLILHHPSRAVVLRSLELLAGSQHAFLDPALRRLLEHEDPEVRSAALTLHAARAPDVALIADLARNDASAAVRATALVEWLGRSGDAKSFRGVADEILERGDRLARVALARALPRLPYPMVADVAHRLIADADEEVPAELARSAAMRPLGEHIPLLIALLARREARPAARAGLVTLESPALEALAEVLRNPAMPHNVRRHLPRTISHFATPLAAALLVEALERDEPRIRYKALRGLGRMRANDSALPVSSGPVESLARNSMERAITMLYYRVLYRLWTKSGSRTHGDEDMLERLLEEKQQRALERVFRALHILQPEHGYGALFDAVRENGAGGAEGREILAYLIDGRIRDGVLALIEPAELAEQLRAALRFFAPDGADRLLAILSSGDAHQPTLPQSGVALEALVQDLFDRALKDPDPILASVVRRRLRVDASNPPPERVHA